MGLGLPAGAIPPEFFAMNMSVATPWPTIPIGALGKVSFINWAATETEAGVFDWSRIDAWIDAAEAHGVDVIYAFERFPEFYDYPGDLDKLEDFVTLVVNRLKVSTVRVHYELWNEPYQLGAYHVGVAMPDQATLVAITDVVAAAVRAADPTALLASPSWAGGGDASQAPYMDAFYDAGGYTDTDIISIHSYPDTSLGLDPEGFSPSRYLLAGIGTNLTAHGLTDQPIWMTEGSWGQAANYDPDLTTDEQVAFIGRWLLLSWSNGCERQYWYSFDNGLWGCLSLRWAQSHKPAIAMLQMWQWMVGATMTAACDNTGTVWSCEFSRPGGYTALAIWDTDGDSAYTPTGPWVQYRRLDGTKTAWSSGDVTIGIKPILFESHADTIARRVRF